MRQVIAVPFGIVIVGWLATTACTDELNRPMSPDGPVRIQEYVTGEAARNLDGSGHFVLVPPSPPADLAIISAGRASELAAAYVRTYGPTMRPGLKLFGAPDLPTEQMEISPRVFYAETPHERFPDVWSLAPRRHFGPYFIVHFLLQGRPALTVAVSAYAHDAGISPDGRLVRPVDVGGLFFHFPVTGDNARVPYRPVSPEEAVEIVAARTGARVTQVPRLLLRDGRFHPVMAQWQLTLDRPVRVIRAADGE
ncbi:MAG: hypothetical protein KY444_06840, partial [Gemmatimonadetes bacterium]|nr:hypothetical protein [Gemmatimonadota bacterium]